MTTICLPITFALDLNKLPAAVRRRLEKHPDGIGCLLEKVIHFSTAKEAIAEGLGIAPCEFDWHVHTSETSETATDELSQGFRHFLRLAKRGKFPAASGGEARAYLLARCVLANVPGLDQTAQVGLSELIEFTSRDPMAAVDLVDQEQVPGFERPVDRRS